MNWFRTWMLPLQGSPHAADVDSLYMFIFWESIFFFVLVAGLTLYFAWRYRRRKEGVLTPNISHNLALEITWSVLPLILVMGIFFWGINDYVRASVAPNDAMEIHVSGKKWLWSFEYPDGTRSIRDLHIPVGRPIKIILTSEDVLHAFFLPTMRIKQDAVPGRYVEMTFTPTVAGKHQIFCAEYCGKDHSQMMGNLYVDSAEKYQEFLEKGDEETQKMPLPLLGQSVWENKGCKSCHSVDGTKNTGPTFKGAYGRMETFTDGTTHPVDDNYIRQSVMEPQAKVVKGFEPVMPTFQGLLREREILGVIEYLKTMK